MICPDDRSLGVLLAMPFSIAGWRKTSRCQMGAANPENFLTNSDSRLVSNWKTRVDGNRVLKKDTMGKG